MKQLNLIPYRIREQRKKKIQIRQQIAVAVVICCVLFFGLYFPMGTRSSLHSEEAKLKQQIDSRKDVIEENNQVKDQIKRIDDYLKQVDLMTANRTSAVTMITGLEAYTPGDVDFIHLTFNDNDPEKQDEMDIEGIAAYYSSIAEFGANLQMTDAYRDARISDIKWDETTKLYGFKLVIKFGGASDEKTN